jgi:hypothetical protein
MSARAAWEAKPPPFAIAEVDAVAGPIVVVPGAIAAVDAAVAVPAGLLRGDLPDVVGAGAAGMGAVLLPCAGLLLLFPPEQPAAVAIATTIAAGRARRCMRGRDMVGSFRLVDVHRCQQRTGCHRRRERPVIETRRHGFTLAAGLREHS